MQAKPDAQFNIGDISDAGYLMNRVQVYKLKGTWMKTRKDLGKVWWFL